MDEITKLMGTILRGLDEVMKLMGTILRGLG
jgi:hypothetical protein